MKNISVNMLNTVPVSEQNTEYVERKGIGHPDSLIDGIVDETSHALCRQYIDEFGTILHHNVDKGLIVGGASQVGFGRGDITRKIQVIITGRAMAEWDGVKIDIAKTAIDVAKDYLRRNTRFLDLDNEVVFESMIAKGSNDLAGIFERGKNGGVPLANDTSFGIGFAPFTETEILALETERYLNSEDYKKLRPAVGEDIKVMGLREKDSVTLTVAIAFVAKFIGNLQAYVEYKKKVEEDVSKYAKKFTNKQVNVHVNTGDGIDGSDVYLTKSGLSCEAGDDGSVGRGNRVNGLITPFRHMSLEAAAGKNPVSHIGKIYNILATELAKDIVNQYPQIKECDIAMLSQIGKKISDPHNLNINIITDDPAGYDDLQGKVRYIADGRLENIAGFTLDVSLGKYKTF